MDTNSVQLHPKAHIECFNFGKEKEPLVKVDNFMSGIDAIKQFAIDNNAFAAADSFYPGIRMAIPQFYTVALLHHLGEYIQNFFGLELKKITKAVSVYSMVTTPREKLSLLQRIPHFDAPTRRSLATVHYLCDAPDSGTALYRHRQLGYEYIDATRYPHYSKFIAQQFSDAQPQGYIMGSTEEYESIFSVEAVYNRIVMYRASSLHSGIIAPDYNCDPNPATGRLTITSFIEFGI